MQMNTPNRWRVASCLVACCLALSVGAIESVAWQRSSNESVPNWIWHSRHRAGHIPQTKCYFRKTVRLPSLRQARLAIAADDRYELSVNGRKIHSGTSADGVATLDLSKHVVPGDNVIAVKVTNTEGNTAGLVGRLVTVDQQNRSQVFVTDSSWKTSLSASLLWSRISYRDRRWAAAKQFGPLANFIELQRATLAANNSGTKPDSATNGASSDDAGVASHSTGNSNSSASAQPAAKAKARVLATAALSRTPASGSELEVPREFEVTQVAGHADVGSLTTITFDARGRMIVAREDGQLWLLEDSDSDGTLDTRKDYGRLTSTCQGMLSIGSSLYVTGKGPNGLALYRLTDTDKDDRLDAVKPIVQFKGTNIEHGPHGIQLGPDGKIYVMVGNHSPLASSIAPTGPYRTVYEGDLVTPRFQDPGGHATGVAAPGGYIIRTDAEGKRVEHVAGGLRNAYDLAFDRTGELFAHDSDMESDRGTTWYRPTRLYHVIEGAEFGWRSGWAKWPDYYPDVLPGVADTGRGSPTGLVAYNHRAFPAAYQNTFFSADWSEGQVYVIRCREKGASFVADPKPFLRGSPLAVTDLDVGPDGSLYLVTGGRGSAGNIYRIHWKGFGAQRGEAIGTGVDAVVRQPQLHSSWARQQLVAIKTGMGDAWAPELMKAARDVRRPDGERNQALQAMHWLGPQPSVDLLRELTGDVRPAVRQHAAFLLGLYPGVRTQQRLAQLLNDPNAIVRRRACEGLVRCGMSAKLSRLNPMLNSDDRFECWAARQVLERKDSAATQKLVESPDTRAFLVGATAALREKPTTGRAQAIIAKSVDLMEGFMSDRDFVDLLRVQQLALIRGGLKPTDVPKLGKRLALEYPSSSHRINRELVRLLVFLNEDSIMDRYVQQLNREHSEEEPLAEKIHLAMHLTFLKAKWSSDDKLKVFEYLASPPNAGNSLPGYLQNAAYQFGESLEPDELLTALARGPENPSSSLAALLRLPDMLTGEQMDSLQQLDQDLLEYDDETHRRLKVGIVAVLGRDGRPQATEYLRTIYDRDPTRRIEVALSMAATDDARNWKYLVRSLPILEPVDALEVVNKLKTIRQWPADAEPYRQVIIVAERLKEKGAKDAIELLEFWQGVKHEGKDIQWKEGVKAWKKWYLAKYPDAAVPEMIVSAEGGKWDASTLLQHLKRSRQEQTGSTERGRNVFVKAQCINCHRVGSDGESMGPELTNVAKRFLPGEILDSMLFPSKVISDQYAAKTVTTHNGEVYTGIVADGSIDELIILQTNGQKLRVPRDEVEEIEPSRISAMPEGLLDTLSLEEITDLFAYLLTQPEARMTQAKKSPTDGQAK